MKKINYTIKVYDEKSKLGKNVYQIIVSDSYDRAMLFLRPQEYMECPNPKFRGKSFNIWDYMKWYSIKFNKGKGFTYGIDWDGFNFPLFSAIECYRKTDDEYELMKKFDYEK